MPYPGLRAEISCRHEGWWGREDTGRSSRHHRHYSGATGHDGTCGHNRTPEALSRVTATLLGCTKESTTPVDDAARAKGASALASALTRTRPTRKPHLKPAVNTRDMAATLGSSPITSEEQYPLISHGRRYHGTASRRVFVP